ncbi:MAG: ABC transporter substrate-binding protein [Alphaproteobacteria bacterium]|nr:ABC transporter substrate-binding protein [Alphaproteobacteria bacterium]
MAGWAWIGVLAAWLATGGGARAAEPIRIGEFNSYTSFAAFTIPYRNGWQLAVEEINRAGGVLGRQLEVISRDDGGKPADAITVANELVAKERVVLLAGTLLSHVGLAVSDFAKQHKVIFIAAEPLTDTIAWSQGNRYTFRLRPGTYVQAAMLAEEAAKLPAKRWVTVAPNYEYGKSAVAAFRELLQKRRPDVAFVAEQWPALGKIDAGATVQALELAAPEAIFNVTFGADLTKFVLEGKLRDLFKGREVVSILGGEPEWIDPLKDQAPERWIVTGYPWYALDTPAHGTFRKAYEAKFNDYPRLGSMVGYVTFKMIAQAIAAANSTETEKVITALRGLKMETPIGPITMRAADHQTTMGTYVGRLTVKDGMPRMIDWRFGDGTTYLPSEADARAMRPAD